mgnify:CR=1 FL=1
MKYVYIAQLNEHYKIGFSGNPSRRVKELIPTKFPIPYNVELVCKGLSDKPHHIERYLHWKFASVRVNGEWFRLNETQLAEAHEIILSGEAPPIPVEPKPEREPMSLDDIRAVQAILGARGGKKKSAAQSKARARKVRDANRKPLPKPAA